MVSIDFLIYFCETYIWICINKKKFLILVSHILFLIFQSLDYDVCENVLFQKEQESNSNSRFSLRKDIIRWIIFIQIGIITALIACAIDIIIEELSARKYEFLKHG